MGSVKQRVEEQRIFKQEPVLFLKPTSSYLANGGTIEIQLQWSIFSIRLSLLLLMARKLVMFLNLRPWIMLQGCWIVGNKEREKEFSSYALGPDTTAKELQAKIKISKNTVPDPHNLELWLKVDGELKQIGPTSDMIFKFPYLISHISTFITLTEGDVILIGTPEGIRPVKPGQKITAGITGLIDVHVDAEKWSTPVSN
ncbi:putative acylpyruvase FAHD1 mitochondrial [Bienertia sinuspersici]